MTAYPAILEWSADRPPWQRDALRVLVSHGEVSETELSRLVRIAKSAHGLLSEHETEAARPLTTHHLPQQSASGGRTTLGKLRHVEGVNALGADQSLTFEPTGMTIVYGDNGAGKSGYVRILKRLCRARVAESRLEPNVFATAPAVQQSAVVDFHVEGANQSFDWAESTAAERTPRELAEISVFDSSSATAYLSTADKAPFAPAGLDILEKLVAVCERMKARLESEMAADKGSRLTIAAVADGTAVKQLLDALSADTRDDEIASLAHFDDADEQRLKELEARRVLLQSSDPKQKERDLRLAARRMDGLFDFLRRLAEFISDEALVEQSATKRKAASLDDAANAMRDATFTGQPLAGIGNDAWRSMWESARRYSTEAAYESQAFPMVGEDARCVLCQQELGADGRARLAQFEQFVRSDVTERATAHARFLQLARENLLGLRITTEEQTLAELDHLQPGLARTLTEFLDAARIRRAAAAAACSPGDTWPEFVALPISPIAAVLAVRDKLHADADELLSAEGSATLQEIQDDINEMRARRWLSTSAPLVWSHLAGLRRRKSYERCVETTPTRTITKKSAELTRKLVSDAMNTAFHVELKNLDVARVGVRIDTEPKRGALLHGVRLDAGANKVPTSRVLSEGECRCVALAAFLAELATASHASSIIFDDPVSSLDHMRRRRVAHRLVKEAEHRQVVVFTHDLAFVLLLKEHAGQRDVPLHTQQVRALSDGPGICQPGVPWAGMNVKERIKRLNEDAQSLGPLRKANDVDAYERETKALYGRLREAWERGVEEVLLNGTIQRFGRAIGTKSLKVVSLLDLEQLEQGMTKSSRWLTGHDDAPELNEPVPPPDEVRQDVKSLADWVDGLRKR